MHIHILAISGQMTSALALELQRQGHLITGSDQEKIYPPISSKLTKAHIPINSTPISSQIDLVIVGSAYQNFPRCIEEFIQIQKHKLPFISATQSLAAHLAKSNSIIIAGSWGKSTICALTAWILDHAQWHPSFFFAAQAINRFPSFKITNSSWSVIEGDESINGLDTRAKFLYYPTKYVLLTSTSWEHRDSYPTPKANLLAYQKLLKNIPPDGLLVYNPQDPNLPKIIKFCQAPAFPYDSSLSFTTSLIGNFNRQNVTAAYTLCRHLGVNDQIIRSSIASFRGLSRRLEIIKKTKNNITFIDDFAQSAPRVKQAILAVHQTYPPHPIKVFFEPHASFLLDKYSLTAFRDSFIQAKEVVLSKLSFKAKIRHSHRATAKDYRQIVGNKLKYIPLPQDIINHYRRHLQSGDILLHFSSGGLLGLQTLNQIIKSFP